jgi:hypothetical protein
MATAASRIDLPVAPERAWRLIGGFGSLPDWLPFIASSQLKEGGRVRHLTTQDGQNIIERLMAFDEQARRYTYHILQAPFPVASYYSTLKVSGAGESSQVDWAGEFTPVGVSDHEASRIFQDIYDAGLKGLLQALKA